MLRHLVATIVLMLNVAYAAQSYHHPEQFLKSLEGKDERAVGGSIYQQFCSTCHAIKPAVPVGAPRIGIKEDWESRQKLRTPEQMLKKIDEGMNAMPPRGGCFECNDQQLLAAIRYLLFGERRNRPF